MTDKICKPYGNQKNWFEFKDKCEKEGLDPNLELAKHLRLIADIIERKDWPDVFGCEIMNINKDGKLNELMGTVSVTLSYPWPG